MSERRLKGNWEREREREKERKNNVQCKQNTVKQEVDFQENR